MTPATLPAELKPENVTAIIDTREQLPVDLAPLKSIVGTLETGDYSYVGGEHVARIERKSLPDLIGCVGVSRERFDREVQRLISYPVRAIVCECSWQELEKGGWRSNITPAAAVGSCLGWIAAGVPVVMAGDHERAGRYISRILFTAARRRWRESRELLRSVSGAAGEVAS